MEAVLVAGLKTEKEMDCEQAAAKLTVSAAAAQDFPDYFVIFSQSKAINVARTVTWTSFIS